MPEASNPAPRANVVVVASSTPYANDVSAQPGSSVSFFRGTPIETEYE